MCARHQHGLTLIELVLFIVIVGVGIAGILTVMNTVVRSSADPMLRKQAIAMADAILEEVLAKDYSDPDGTSGETERALMDDVDDYAHFDGSTAARKILGSDMLGGSESPLPDTYWARIVIEAPAAVNGVTMKRITVTVTDPAGDAYALTGYRADY
jgi:MSHA pilin protein MshD